MAFSCAFFVIGDHGDEKVGIILEQKKHHHKLLIMAQLFSKTRLNLVWIGRILLVATQLRIPADPHSGPSLIQMVIETEVVALSLIVLDCGPEVFKVIGKVSEPDGRGESLGSTAGKGPTSLEVKFT